MYLFKLLFILSLVFIYPLVSKDIMKERFTIDTRYKYLVKPSVKFSKELNQTIQLGYSNTSGNANTLHLNGEYNLGMTLGGCSERPLKIGFKSVAFISKNEDVLDSEEYRMNLGLEQSLGEKWLGYLTSAWLKNRFKNYKHKISMGTGIGRIFFQDSTRLLTMKLGLAHNHFIYRNEQISDKFTSLDEYLEYSNKLTLFSKLFFRFGASQNIADFNNDYELLALGGIKVTVIESLSISFEEEISYDHLPAVGFNRTDTKTLMRIGYSF